MSAFRTIMPGFDAYLTAAKDDFALVSVGLGAPQNVRFIPRNFLIEEQLESSRVGSYADHLPVPGPANFVEWNKAHNEYLRRYVFIPSTPLHDYRVVPLDNPNVCPETFRAASALRAFQETDLDTYLIRLVAVTDVSWLSGHREDHIYSLGDQVITNSTGAVSARQELSQILEEAYTSPRCDHRPVFAAFYEDFLDELRDSASTSWPNRLRDRLGLFHLSQLHPNRLPHRVFLFRYPVRDVPRKPGDPDRRPMTVPVVLDHRLSESFCPAPHELDRGRLLNLQDNAVEEPAREVLHLFMPMQVEHLFRVGLVTTPVAEDLAPARRDHLIWMRLQADRELYASDTDADLL